MNAPWWLAKVRAALKRKHGPPRDRRAREAVVAAVRKEAFGDLTEETRAADKQRLADAAAGKGKLI